MNLFDKLSRNDILGLIVSENRICDFLKKHASRVGTVAAKNAELWQLKIPEQLQ
jgi:hypothetical protein